jgi:hypothetical protein
MYIKDKERLPIDDIPSSAKAYLVGRNKQKRCIKKLGEARPGRRKEVNVTRRIRGGGEGSSRPRRRSFSSTLRRRGLKNMREEESRNCTRDYDVDDVLRNGR